MVEKNVDQRLIKNLCSKIYLIFLTDTKIFFHLSIFWEIIHLPNFQKLIINYHLISVSTENENSLGEKEPSFHKSLNFIGKRPTLFCIKAQK